MKNALLALALAALLAAPRLLLSQAYTYTINSDNNHPTGDLTLRAGESLYIPNRKVYTGHVTFEGTGQTIVNDWIWLAPPLVLPAGATFVNNYICSMQHLELGAGATFTNRHEASVLELVLARGGTVQNEATGWLQVYSDVFTNAGLIHNCGVLLAKSWPSTGTITGCNPLPVQLISFTATPLAGAVALRWTVAQEVNLARYEVERSPDGRVFTALSEQPARGFSAYAATDKARPGRQYYRLRLVDTDATFRYSPVVALDGAALVSQTWYNEIGQRLGAPRPGFLLEISTYANGAVERRRYLQQ